MRLLYPRLLAILVLLLPRAVSAQEKQKTFQHQEKEHYYFSLGVLLSVDFLEEKYIIPGASININYNTKPGFFLGAELFFYYNFTGSPFFYLCPGYFKQISDMITWKIYLKTGILTSDPKYFDIGGGISCLFFLYKIENLALSLYLDFTITYSGVVSDEPMVTFRPSIGALVHF